MSVFLMSGKLGQQFSTVFGIDPDTLAALGVFDPTLDIDAPLFVDPFLLSKSRHPEFSQMAFDAYIAHFEEVYRLLRLSKDVGDKAWQAAERKFRFSEVEGLHGTCLGYSKSSTRGHAFGPLLARRALGWAKQVIDLGVQDPEMFSSLSLFEEGIGADLISDMVTNIAVAAIVAFNARVLTELRAAGYIQLPIHRVDFPRLKGDFVMNPHDERSPIILLPDDILKNLPIAEDVTQIGRVIGQNAALRDKVNAHLSEVFKIRYKKEREYIKSIAMRDSVTFQTFLDVLKELEKEHYDVQKDPAGLIVWRKLADAAAGVHPLQLKTPGAKPHTVDFVNEIVTQIITKFKQLVEVNRLNRVFFVDGEPRFERFAQLLFFGVAESYCSANNLDVSPESDAGAGPVDFKMSSGGAKVVVEIKLSTNGQTVKGFAKQLDTYIDAERADRGHYVIIDVGKLGNKWRDLKALHSRNQRFAAIKSIHLINGKLQPSASKRS